MERSCQGFNLHNQKLLDGADIPNGCIYFAIVKVHNLLSAIVNNSTDVSTRSHDTLYSHRPVIPLDSTHFYKKVKTLSLAVPTRLIGLYSRVPNNRPLPIINFLNFFQPLVDIPTPLLLNLENLKMKKGNILRTEL